MKGTTLWQGPGSPIIQGKSRQVRPFWRAWVAAALMAVVASNFATWGGLRVVPVEFFVLGSFAFSALGVWMARVSGSLRPWRLGLLLALVANAAIFASMWVWIPAALLHLGKA